MFSYDIDGHALYTPDGKNIQLPNLKDHHIPKNAFLSVTGVLQRGPWDFYLTDKLEFKVLYDPKAGTQKANE